MKTKASNPSATAVPVARAYFEALKPERTFFNVMTAAAGFLFASRWHIDWLLFFYLLLGTTLVVMSACAANNLTDRKLDAKMPRTQKRATATGEVPVRSLVIIAVVFGIVGTAILAVHVNVLVAVLGLVGYVDYVVLYGWSKRATPWSTLVGTISGAMPLMAGYVAVTGQLDATAWLLGLVMVFWQMVHFYAIAIFREKDYQAGNIPVWPIRYGIRNTQYQMLFFTSLYLITVIYLTVFASLGWVFLAITAGFGIYWLWLGLKGLQALKPEKWARGMFGVSLVILLVFSIALPLAPLLP